MKQKHVIMLAVFIGIIIIHIAVLSTGYTPPWYKFLEDAGVTVLTGSLAIYFARSDPGKFQTEYLVIAALFVTITVIHVLRWVNGGIAMLNKNQIIAFLAATLLAAIEFFAFPYNKMLLFYIHNTLAWTMGWLLMFFSYRLIKNNQGNKIICVVAFLCGLGMVGIHSTKLINGICF